MAMKRLAKIVATVGPASKERELIQNLMLTGVNVFRLNFSHGEAAVVQEIAETIRDVSQELSLPVAILGDLQGPKFRVGLFEGHQPIPLAPGQLIRFNAQSEPGNAELITTNTPQIVESVQVGDEILLDDGNLSLEVTERISPREVMCRVIYGGILKERKGINVPTLALDDIPSMTEKDKTDAKLALALDLDFIALSFVRSEVDIGYLRNFIDEHIPCGQRPPKIIAKIEKPQAVDNIDAIIAATDGIMVARGDLGVEMKPQRVPLIQKMIIRKANQAQKPVITATQMLETMTQNPKPTRAEVSDVANAVFDGSDALMLSGETAVGQYPIEAVRMMANIIEESETRLSQNALYNGDLDNIVEEMLHHQPVQFHQAIAQAACHASEAGNTTAIVVLSYSGSMAQRISKSKPHVPIIALTPHTKVFRTLNILRGIYPVKINACVTSDETLLAAEHAIHGKGYLNPMDPIVFCAGQTHLMGLSNTLKMYCFGDLIQQEKQHDTQIRLDETPLVPEKASVA